jgi:signal transduction histidine kinase
MNTDKQSTSRARILVVDDNPGATATLARAISRLGPNFEVISATDGNMALEQIQGKAVDLVITDMMMPGMNGLELIEKLRQVEPGGSSTYAILITAYDVLGLKESARRLKVNEMLIKPVRPERICQIVGGALEEMVPSSPPGPAPETKRPFTILIADDNLDNVSLLSRYLKDEYSLSTAYDGEETLEKTRAEMPDLLLLDVNMPEMDGFQVLREIRSDPAIEHIPVIILTAARLDPADMQFALNLGADDYVMKPFDRRELLARIRTKLRVKEAEDVIRRRNKELSLLPEIGKDLSARLDIDELVNVVLHRTVETLGAMLGHILILNTPIPIHKEYRLSTVSAEVQLPNLTHFLEQIKGTRQGLILNNTKDDPRWEALPDDPIRSAIIVPMFGRLELIGALVLTHEKVGYFNLEHQLLLQAITSQAAIALENAQLYTNMAHEKQRMTAVLESVADSILMFDARGNLLLLNPAGEKLFSDYSAKIDMSLARGCGYDALIELLDETISSRKPQSGEIEWPDQRIFSVQFTPIGAGGCVAILHDVSHFKAVERVKDEFISTASHDLKNPITTVLGFSEMLPKAGPLNESQTEFVNYIHSAAEHMRQLVQDLLELAKADMDTTPVKKIVDLQALVSAMVGEFRLQAEAKKQSLQLEETKDQPMTEGDLLSLQQALRNLINNAIKYTPEGGAIRVILEMEAGDAIIRIKDTGYGIPAKDLPFIFDRFYRVRNEDVKNIEGNGLGLAIVKSIIEKQGGQISVKSELHKGSCFSVFLPVFSTSN